MFDLTSMARRIARIHHHDQAGKNVTFNLTQKTQLFSASD